ncbi:MAG TPA: squalene synthase HpnC [Acidobacteriota bacterium]|nr:squalene synthase HpnC [Acidobacteriota bacterium]
MNQPRFEALLREYRFTRDAPAECSLAEAQEFCRKLARSHYENFIVASFFLPARLKQHFYNIYAYCRISDDLGDEAGDPGRALELLDQWEDQLRTCFAGQARHPVFVALRETIEAFQSPMTPFADLLHAFRQDQRVKRYDTYEQVLDYCRYSANPVGRLVLYLFGYSDEERQALSDRTCTALQLANHWQDVERDLRLLDRIYIPMQDMKRFQYTEEELKAGICDRRFKDLMTLEVERARQLFDEGLGLAGKVDRTLALDVELFSRSGLQVLHGIEDVDYDVLHHRPEITKWNRFKILAGCWWNRRRA